jgi:DNA repair protein RadC
VLAADRRSLFEVGGSGAAHHIALMREAMLHMLKTDAYSQPVLSSSSVVVDYLMAALAHEPVEQIRILFLNARNGLIRDEVMWSGCVDTAPIYPRQVMRRALDLGAVSLILVHNHPSGDPQPSLADIGMTKDLRRSGEALGVELLDHLIIARSGHVSFRARGLMD